MAFRKTERTYRRGHSMIKVLQGDCLASMRTLPDLSINCCITSPPYYGLRAYGGGEAEIGIEKTPEEYITNMVNVFKEVKRVLRADGVIWVNIGDSYAGSGKGQWNGGSSDPKNNKTRGMPLEIQTGASIGLKNKDLIGIPWMLAFALRADGWYLRQDIIWHKPNPMPESVRDRCTKAHEYVFLLSKSPKYYYDNEAIKYPVKQDWGTRDRTNGKYHNEGTGLQPHTGLEKSYTMANKRSVWTINTKPYKGAHFATFPPDLVEPCVLAGCPEGGTVIDPFGGSGTVAGVAVKNNRKAILCELNAEYIDLIPARVLSISGYHMAESLSVEDLA